MVNVSAENVGEPGYACELYMNFSTVLELRDTRDCNMENSTYVCPFSNRLEHVKKEVKEFVLSFICSKTILHKYASYIKAELEMYM